MPDDLPTPAAAPVQGPEPSGSERPRPLTMDEMLCGAPFMILAPHPDDEVLGCGGLLAMAADAGISGLIVTLTDGGASHCGPGWPASRLAEQRAQEVHNGLAAIDAHNAVVVPLGLPDGMLDQEGLHAPLFATLAQLARRHRAHTLFVTDIEDGHPDHKAAYRLATDLLSRGIVSRLYAFPVTQRLDGCNLGRFHRLPTARVATRKLAAIQAHSSQVGAIPALHGGFLLSAEAIRSFASEDELFLQVALATV